MSDSQSPIQETNGRRRLWLWVLLLILLTIASVSCRLLTNRHFGRMYVRLPEPVVGAESIDLFTCSADGTLAPLTRRDNDLRLYSRSSDWAPVTSVVIAGKQAAPFAADAVEVFLGAGWKHVQLLRLREIRPFPLDDRRIADYQKQYGLTWATEIVPYPGHGSRLAGKAQIVNWQGDWMLLLFALTQGLAGTLLIRYLVWAFGRLPALGRGGDARVGPVDRVVLFAGELLRVVLLVLILHLCWCWFSALVLVREAPQYIAGMVLAAFVLGLLAAWNSMVDRAECPRRMWWKMLLLAVAVMVLKLIWLSAVEVRPKLPDYAYFHRFGSQLAALDWEGITNGPKGIALIYLRRAATFAWPTAFLFGNSITAYENVNLFLQSGTIWMFCVLVRRMFGWRVAARALPVLLIYPDYWYLPGMVTHNIVGYFWMMACFLIVDTFLRLAAFEGFRRRGIGRRALTGAILGVGAGISCGMLDLSKSYGIFITAAIFLCLTVGGICSKLNVSGIRLHRFGLQTIVFLLTTFVTQKSLTMSVDSFLSGKTGLKVPESWYTNVVASIESAGPGTGDAIIVWSSQYAERIPRQYHFPVTARKILHEKLSESGELLQCILRKNAVLAMAHDSFTQVQDDLSTDKAQPRIDNVYWGTMQFTWSNALMLFIGITASLRLLSRAPLLWSESELIPITMLSLVMLSIYVLLESHVYYALNFVMPFSCSAGLMTEKLRGIRSTRVYRPLEQLWSVLPVGRVIAALMIAAAVGLVLEVGESLDRSGLVFRQVRMLPTSQRQKGSVRPDSVESVGAFQSGISRVHGWLECKVTRGVILRDATAVQDFEVDLKSSELYGLGFFLSGNQRFRQCRDLSAWNDLPIRYSLAVGGRTLVEDRPISDLAIPRFKTVPPEVLQQDGKKTGRVIVTVTLRCEEDAAIGRVFPPPAVAVEYFH